MARRPRASEMTFLTFEVDDSELRAKIARLSAERLTKDLYMPVLKAVLTTLQRRAVGTAKAQGLDQTTEKTKNRWTWSTRARIPASIKVGKRWRIKGYAAGRVFTKTGPGGARAPHANPLIAGYRQMIPTGLPGKGQVRFSKNQPARPIYSTIKGEAQSILTATLKRAIAKLEI
jgi:hypothetical protein